MCLFRHPKRQKVTKLYCHSCSLIGPAHCPETNDQLTLPNAEVRRGFEDFFLPTESDRSRAHLVLAGEVQSVCFSA